MLIKLEWLKKLWPYVKPFSFDTGTLRTDGQTDRFAISISRVNMLTRDKNSRVRRIHMSKPTVQQYQQCCHLANGNKTCRSLLLFKNNNVAHWRVDLRGLYAKVHETWHYVYSNHLCLTIFFQNYNILPRSGVRAESLRAGSEKYAKFRHFLAHLVV